MFSRVTRSLILTAPSKLEPKIDKNIHKELQRLRSQSTINSNKSSKQPKEFRIGEKIRIQTGHRQWKEGVVTEKYSSRSLLVKSADNQILKRNTSQLHHTKSNWATQEHTVIPNNTSPIEQQTPTIASKSSPTNNNEQNIVENPHFPNVEAPSTAMTPIVMQPTTRSPSQNRTRSGRTIKKPDKLNL